jgi:hypothetical protein
VVVTLQPRDAAGRWRTVRRRQIVVVTLNTNFDVSAVNQISQAAISFGGVLVGFWQFWKKRERKRKRREEHERNKTVQAELKTRRKVKDKSEDEDKDVS